MSKATTKGSQMKTANPNKETTMELNTKQFGAFCFDNYARVEWIIPLAGAHDGESCCGTLADFIDDSTAEEIETVFPGISAAMEEYGVDPEGDSRERRSAILEWLNNRQQFGYLASVATVSRQYRDPKFKSFTCSWGISYPGTIYADSIPEFIEKFKAFIADRVQADKQQYAKKERAALEAKR